MQLKWKVWKLREAAGCNSVKSMYPTKVKWLSRLRCKDIFIRNEELPVEHVVLVLTS